MSISFGLPAPGQVAASNEGRLVLGGCDVADPFRRECKQCGFRWGDIPNSAFDQLHQLAEAATLHAEMLIGELDDRFTPMVNGYLEHTPEPWRFASHDTSTFEITLGDPGLVELVVRPSHMIEVLEFRVRGGPPAWSVRAPIDHGHRVPGLQDVADEFSRTQMLVTAISDVHRRRAAKFKRCANCGRLVAPEEGSFDDHCGPCAASELGIEVVY